MTPESITYDKAEMRAILRSFRAMDEQATRQAKEVSAALATEALQAIQQAASGPAQTKIAQGGRVSKSSKVAEFSFGYVGQKYGGGGNTQLLWPGYEFGSTRYKQFAPWSGRYGKGSRGKFIYPTLRRLQPTYIRRWEEALAKIMKEWA